MFKSILLLTSVVLLWGPVHSLAKENSPKNRRGLHALICKQFDDDGYTTLASLRILKKPSLKSPTGFDYQLRYRYDLNTKQSKSIQHTLVPDDFSYNVSYRKNKGSYKHEYVWQLKALKPPKKNNSLYAHQVDISTQLWANTHLTPLRGAYQGAAAVHLTFCPTCQDGWVDQFNVRDCIVQVN